MQFSHDSGYRISGKFTILNSMKIFKPVGQASWWFRLMNSIAGGQKSVVMSFKYLSMPLFSLHSWDWMNRLHPGGFLHFFHACCPGKTFLYFPL